MNQPIDSPAAWYADELFSRDDWLHTLDEAEVAEVGEALAHSRQAGCAAEELTPVDFPLQRLGERLRGIQRSLEEGSGAAMIRGLPIDRWDEEEATRIFFGLTSYIGAALSQSPAGERVFHVRDEGYQDGHAKARGPSSRKRLTYHTDRCDVIGFLCLRQAKSGGENYVVSSVTLYNELLKRRPDLAETLTQPFRYQRHNVDLGNELPYYEQPVMSMCDGHFAANLMTVLIERAYSQPDSPPMSSLQREALDCVQELADDPLLRVSFRQQPGDIVLLNNFITLHRRSEFEDHDDPARKRHLLRIWLSVPNSRPLDPRFAPSYGDTRAGALRGGMKVAE